MTIRDPEILDALRDEPELLALADAVAETQRLPRRRHWVVPGSLAAVGLAAAAVALAILLWPGGGGSHPILDRALAAIGDKPVLHIVAEAPTGSVLVDLASGRQVVETYTIESWIDRDGQHLHMLVRSGGKLAGDVLLPDDAENGGVGRVDGGPAYDALWTGYRRALDSGAAKIVGDGTIYGHAVYWLRFPASRGEISSDVAIDRETYKPLAFRVPTAPRGSMVTRVLTFETTPFRSADFRRVGPSLLGGSSSGSVTGLPAPVGTQAKPLLVAGQRLAGLRLGSVTATVVTGKSQVDGVVLTYGREAYSPGPRTLTIEELPKPEDPSAWRIPRGKMRIQKGFSTGSSSSGRGRPTWTGSLVKDGVYVTIETGVSMRAVLEAARALHRPA